MPDCLSMDDIQFVVECLSFRLLAEKSIEVERWNLPHHDP
jgi:hypothetical protein